MFGRQATDFGRGFFSSLAPSSLLLGQLWVYVLYCGYLSSFNFYMTPFLRSRFSTFLVAGLFVFPASLLLGVAYIVPAMNAAGPLDAVNKDLGEWFVGAFRRERPLAVSMPLSFQVNVKSYKKGDPSGMVKIDTQTDLERYPTESGTADYHSRFRINSLQVDVNSENNLPFPIKFPAVKNVLAVESMIVDGTIYVRLTAVAPEVAEQIEKTLGESLPLDEVLGVWVKFDEQLVSQYKEAGEEELPVPSSLELQAFYESVKPFFVLKGVEKKYAEKGERMVRIRLALNPQALVKFEKLLRKDIVEKYTDAKVRQAKLRELSEGMVEVRKFVGKTSMVAVVNESKGKLVRLEFGGQDIYPLNDYKPAGKNTTKMVKVKTGEVTFKYNTALSVRPLEDQVLAPPEGAITPEEWLTRVSGRLADSEELSAEEADLGELPASDEAE